MKSVVIHHVIECREVTTKYGEKYVAELEIIGEPKQTFWMSVKQGGQLAKCAHQLKDGNSTKRSELHVVIDDSGEKPRFVWCGLHTASRSDIPFLQEKFGVVCESPYIGFQDASPRDAAAALKDE